MAIRLANILMGRRKRGGKENNPAGGTREQITFHQKTEQLADLNPNARQVNDE
ncbi:hypothetical protein [Avibacterium sp. 21-599]|uniref:hypothetical protein n=1 Tax=Avibacterium sp. 21-599 TaxID=2911528 RepID=UPI00224674C6|nr:hypothetical protein [Avibacterium sp. 21-599]MCW9719092.1 hypothetical protein [Avibacterium sp. 21-599]